MIYDQMFEMLNVGIVIFDAELKVVMWNRWMSTHSGIDPETIIGQPLFSFFPDLDFPRFRRNIKAVFAFGSFSFFSQKLHGFLFPFKACGLTGACFENMQQNCTMGPLRENNDRVTHVFITVEDVTSMAVYEQKLTEMNITDALTGIYNRRYLITRLKEEFETFKRYEKPFSLIMFDIDFFKLINDTYGHQAGDHILKSFSDICKETIRSSDLMARYGGEEFCCLLPETISGPARELADRIRKKIEGSVFTYNDNDIHITVSGGVSEVKKELGSVDGLLEKADKALYIAKESGRNKIVAMN
ncbi:MAG: GGDEF domain-containing protein [Deltaproteobacteria bacterium]|nr:GGDEF domain-containing protein [Deltaproteobacteria bacterium]